MCAGDVRCTLTLPSSPRLCLLDRTWIHNISDGEYPGIMVSTRITLWKTSFLQQDEWRHRQKSTNVGCFLDSYDIMAVVWTLSHGATCFYNVSSALLIVFIYLSMSLLLKMVIKRFVSQSESLYCHAPKRNNKNLNYKKMDYQNNTEVTQSPIKIWNRQRKLYQTILLVWTLKFCVFVCAKQKVQEASSVLNQNRREV